MPDDYDLLKRECRKIIGKDYLYLSAEDPQRHSEPISLAAGFGAALLLAFVTSAGEKTRGSPLEANRGNVSWGTFDHY